MRKYAIINNNVVRSIVDLDEEQIREVSKQSEMVVDITDQTRQPKEGWILNGNKLEIPQNLSSREAFEIELNSRKSDFGIKLAKMAIDRIGARNKILDKSGAQVTVLLTSLLGVKSLLETGALGTARNACAQLKMVYTEYDDIFTLVINEINMFESAFGL